MYPKKTLAVLTVIGFAPLALAHADLAATSIEDGSTLTAAPSEISLTFTEPVEVGFSTFKVYPVDTTATAETEHSEAEGDHDNAAAHGDGGHAESDHQVGAADSHGVEGGHAELDAAAEAVVANVLELQDDQDARVDRAVQPENGRSETVALALQADLEPGAYVAMWRVLSVDGHTIEGFLTFTFEPGGN